MTWCRSRIFRIIHPNLHHSNFVLVQDTFGQSCDFDKFKFMTFSALLFSQNVKSENGRNLDNPMWRHQHKAKCCSALFICHLVSFLCHSSHFSKIVRHLPVSFVLVLSHTSHVVCCYGYVTFSSNDNNWSGHLTFLTYKANAVNLCMTSLFFAMNSDFEVDKRHLSCARTSMSNCFFLFLTLLCYLLSSIKNPWLVQTALTLPKIVTLA